MNYEELLSQLVNIDDDPENHLEIMHQIGDGSYGDVYKARDKRTGVIFAVKITYVVDRQTLEGCLREIQILSDCSSEFIVTYNCTYHKKNQLWIVMEYCEFGSLKKIMKWRQSPFNETLISAIVFCALKGISYIHSKKMIHRDIKADNILIDSNGRAKIIDFGVSTKLLSTYSCANSILGSPYWMSPESLQNENYTSKTDIWSLGITSIEIAEGLPPYHDKMPFMVMELIKRKPAQNLTEPDKYSEEFQNFVKMCLTIDADERPTANDLLEHPFIISGQKNLPQLKRFVNENKGLFDDIQIPVRERSYVNKINLPKIGFSSADENMRGVSQNETTSDANGSDDRRSIVKANSQKINHKIHQNSKNDKEENLKLEKNSKKRIQDEILVEHESNFETIVYHNVPERKNNQKSQPQPIIKSHKKQSDNSNIDEHVYSPAINLDMDDLLQNFARVLKELEYFQSQKRLGLSLMETQESIYSKISQVESEKKSEIDKIERKYDEKLADLSEFSRKSLELKIIYDKLISSGIQTQKLKDTFSSNVKQNKQVVQKANINTNAINLASFSHRNSGNASTNMGFLKKNNLQKEILKKENPKMSNFVNIKTDKTHSRNHNVNGSDRSSEFRYCPSEIDFGNQSKGIKSTKNFEVSKRASIANKPRTKQTTNLSKFPFFAK